MSYPDRGKSPRSALSERLLASNSPGEVAIDIPRPSRPSLASAPGTGSDTPRKQCFMECGSQSSTNVALQYSVMILAILVNARIHSKRFFDEPVWGTCFGSYYPGP